MLGQGDVAEQQESSQGVTPTKEPCSLVSGVSPVSPHMASSAEGETEIPRVKSTRQARMEPRWSGSRVLVLNQHAVVAFDRAVSNVLYASAFVLGQHYLNPRVQQGLPGTWLP